MKFYIKNLVTLFVAIAFILTPTTTTLARETTGQSIYEKYKDAICDIDTNIDFKDGKKDTTGGSGFFINKEGQILTAAHAVRYKLKPKLTKKEEDSIDKYSYSVTLPSRNRKYKAKLLGSNDYADIALLQVLNIDPKEYAVVKLGDSNKIKVGDRLWAIGNPRSLANSLTHGYVSFLGRITGLHYIEAYIQTDCPINFGNSGCPVFNDKEEVVGIANSLKTESDGLGFAQPIALAKIESLKKGSIELPNTGFEAMLENFPRDGKSDNSPGFEDLTTLNQKTKVDELDNLLALAKETCGQSFALIVSVDEHLDPSVKTKKPSAAKEAKLEKGDIVTSIDNISIRSGMDIRVFLMDKKKGEKIKITYKRAEAGKMIERTTELTLTERPAYLEDKKEKSSSEDEPDNEDEEDDDEEPESNKKNKGT